MSRHTYTGEPSSYGEQDIRYTTSIQRPAQSPHETGSPRRGPEGHISPQFMERQSQSAAPSPDQRPRGLDVSTILNPTPQRPPPSPRRHSHAQPTSPQSSSRPIRQFGTARSLPPSPVEIPGVDSVRSGPYSRGMPPWTPPASSGRPPHARHTPRSSLSEVMSVPGGSFPPRSPKRQGPGLPLERLPGPSSIQQQGHPGGYPFPPLSGPHHYQSSYTTSNAQPSASTSPSSSDSSHARPLPPTLSTPPPFSTPLFSSGPETPGIPLPPVGTGSPITGPFGALPPGFTSYHGTFPMMSLSTAHGTMQIPVDTTAASKIADEKRKRNAGASARFRQRRKEREREMSIRIANLEQKLKKAEEERDYYMDIVVRSRQQGGQHPERLDIGRLPDVRSLPGLAPSGVPPRGGSPGGEERRNRESDGGSRSDFGPGPMEGVMRDHNDQRS